MAPRASGLTTPIARYIHERGTATGKRVQAVVATRPEINDALAHVYRLQESLDQFLQHVPDESLTINELRDEGSDLRTAVREAELPRS